MAQPPARKINVNDLPWAEFRSGERIAVSFRDAGRAVGSKRIGMKFERIAPGFRASRLHQHLFQEEMFYVARGKGTLLHGDERIALGPGDFVSYHAGDPVAHTIENTGGEEIEILVFGERFDHEVCLFPEDKMVWVEGVGKDLPLPDDDGEIAITKVMENAWTGALSRAPGAITKP